MTKKFEIRNNTTDNVPELKSPFEQLREVDAESREWWNSRKLARVMGYGKYWNFERVMVKAAREYFAATMTPGVMAKSMESTIMLYKGARGKAQVQVIFDTDTFWLSQQRMAELFGVTVPTINYHLDQINQSGEIHLSDGYKKYLYGSEKWSDETTRNHKRTYLNHTPSIYQCPVLHSIT